MHQALRVLDASEWGTPDAPLYETSMYTAIMVHFIQMVRGRYRHLFPPRYTSDQIRSIVLNNLLQIIISIRTR